MPSYGGERFVLGVAASVCGCFSIWLRRPRANINVQVGSPSVIIGIWMFPNQNVVFGTIGLL